MSILLLAEHNHHSLHASTNILVSVAKDIAQTSTSAQKIIVLVMGENCQSVAEEAAMLSGVDAVWLADDPAYAHGLPEACAALVSSLATSMQYVLTSATTYGKRLLPRIAARLDVAQISEVTAILDADTISRPIYAGNAIETLRHLDPIKLWSIRTTAFIGSGEKQVAASIERIKPILSPITTKFIHHEQVVSDRPDLSRASVVVSGGRGVQSAEHFQLIERLADHLGAAVGASRAAVDAGFISNDHQVGQTGKIVAPDLYIAIGISGAIQHLAGMKDSKVIVAINKDPDAPIFQIANYGLVGDLFELIPQWIAQGEAKC